MFEVASAAHVPITCRSSSIGLSCTQSSLESLYLRVREDRLGFRLTIIVLSPPAPNVELMLLLLMLLLCGSLSGSELFISFDSRFKYYSSAVTLFILALALPDLTRIFLVLSFLLSKGTSESMIMLAWLLVRSLVLVGLMTSAEFLNLPQRLNCFQRQS